MRIENYTYIVITQPQDTFEYHCNLKIKEGWVLVGGVTIAYDASIDRIFYAQAFKKE